MCCVAAIMSDVVKRSYSYCFNPFKLPNHRKRNKILMRVTSAMLVKLKMQDVNLSSDLKVCKSCSVKISKLPKEQSVSELCAPGTSDVNVVIESVKSDTPISSSGSSVSIVDVEKLNESLVTIGESPIKKRKLSKKNIQNKKCRKLQIHLNIKYFISQKTQLQLKIQIIPI